MPSTHAVNIIISLRHLDIQYYKLVELFFLYNFQEIPITSFSSSINVGMQPTVCIYLLDDSHVCLGGKGAGYINVTESGVILERGM